MSSKSVPECEQCKAAELKDFQKLGPTVRRISSEAVHELVGKQQVDCSRALCVPSGITDLRQDAMPL